MIDIRLLNKHLNPEVYPRTYIMMEHLSIFQERSLLLEIYIPLYVNYNVQPQKFIEFTLRPTLTKILNRIQNNGKPTFDEELMNFNVTYSIRKNSSR